MVLTNSRLNISGGELNFELIFGQLQDNTLKKIYLKFWADSFINAPSSAPRVWRSQKNTFQTELLI